MLFVCDHPIGLKLEPLILLDSISFDSNEMEFRNLKYRKWTYTIISQTVDS